MIFIFKGIEFLGYMRVKCLVVVKDIISNEIYGVFVQL